MLTLNDNREQPPTTPHRSLTDATATGFSRRLLPALDSFRRNRRERISSKVASEISRRTGVSEAWLTGDLQGPMVAVDGKPYTFRKLPAAATRLPFFSRAPIAVAETPIRSGV